MATSESPHHELVARLRLKKYNRGECQAALRGQAVPHTLGLPLLRLCVVRGIRYHPGYGEELRGVDPVFTRALNARSIMSDMIPDLDPDRPEEVPYRIWHPHVASESTYRELVRLYPHMAYQVGRACAVAGYSGFYQELGLLPEVHIAEEARECGSVDIYEGIMAAPVRYNVMDDYTRSIHTEDPRPGNLNGDTAVCRSLNVRQKFRPASIPEEDSDDDSDGDDDWLGLFGDRGYDEKTFNITEDMNIDESETDDSSPPKELTHDVTRYLFTALPADLPIVDKDLLILVAAYNGDIDRYARLRRPSLF